MPLHLIDRFHPKLRDKQQAAIDAGQLYKRDELELLDPQNLRPLLMVSVVMLIIGTVFFVSSGEANPILGQSCLWHFIVARKISCSAVTSISW